MGQAGVGRRRGRTARSRRREYFPEAGVQTLYSRHYRGLCAARGWHPELVRSEQWGIWKKNKSTAYGTFKKGRERRKGKKHHCVAKGLRLRIPLCNLTVFNSYILMPRRPLCQSTLAPSRSHLAAAKWISSARGRITPSLAAPGLPATPHWGFPTGSTKRRGGWCHRLSGSEWDKLCFSQVPLWSSFSLFFFLKEGGRNLIEGFLPSAQGRSGH